jgi:hypothetical protein
MENRSRTALLFAIVGLACALRPEGLVLLVAVLLARRRTVLRDGATAGLMLAATLLPCLLLYAVTTRHVIPSSGVSRMMAARRDATSVRLGFLWVYGSPIIRLAVYAPLTVAACLTWKRSKVVSAVVVGALAAYVLVIGAAHTSRYMIWIFALLSVLASASVSGDRFPRVTALGLLWIVLAAAGETYARVCLHAGGSGDGVLLSDVVAAPPLRKEQTDALLADLGLGGCHPAAPAVALVEVQERFWLDDRIRVLSLDGVTTSAGGREAKYDTDGCPHLGDVLLDPDVIGLLASPLGEFPGCAISSSRPVRHMSSSWGHDDTPGWRWLGGMMVRSCSAHALDGS